MAIRLALLDGHYRADREWTGGRLPAAEERLARWRAAAAAVSGPDAQSTIDAIRARLADDLDTEAAISAVDSWVERTLAGGPDAADQAQAPGQIRAAVDALLGVAL
jgi:L-cysteine:1D-myo-inositol 2-amino-2-deoxy-alpha-D-glucopyranoside ligase